MRQEFERHRYVSQIGVVDMLLFQSHAEYQVCSILIFGKASRDMRLGFNGLKSEKNCGYHGKHQIWLEV